MQPPPDPSIFRRYAHDRYPPLKTQFLSLDRRALLLLIADEFWTLDAPSWAAIVPSPPLTQADGADDNGDDDDNDDEEDATSPGIVLRTDYSSGSDEAWAAFCGALRDAEREFLADQEGPASASAPDDDGDVEMAPVPAAAPRSLPAGGGGAENAARVSDGEAEGDAEEEEGEEGEGPALFSLVSDSTRFDGISNLRALRLLFDVSVRAAPGPLPAQAPTSVGPAHHHQKKQHQHQHRLTCKRGLQETYETRGRTLWIFDARSRIDNCARLVSEAGDVATGDSWRARVTHLAELQASLAARVLRIDFGGLDRWDYAERQRNMREADAGHAAALSETK